MTEKIKKRAIFTLPARASVFYTLTGALERGINVLFTPIFTRILTPAEYGVYPLYVSWLGIFTVFLTLELSGNIMYRALTRYKHRQYELIMTAYFVLASLSLLAVLSVLIFPRFFVRLTSLSRPLILLLILQIFINGVINLYLSLCKYSYRYKIPSAINLINAIISPTLSFLIIYLFKFKAISRILSPLIVGGIIAFTLLIIILKASRGRISLDILRYLISISLPLLPHFISLTAIAQLGKIMIGIFFGSEAIAKYSLVFSVGFIFTLFTVGIQSSLMPWINRKLSHGAGHTVDLLCEKLFLLFSVLSLLSVTFMPEGLAILAPKEYSDALVAVYPISISVLLTFLSSILYTMIIYYEKSVLITLSSVSSAIICLILHLILDRRLLYLGAGLTQAISSLCLVVFYSVILLAVIKKDSFKPRKYLMSLLISVLFATLLYIFRFSLLSRIIIFIALILMLIPASIDCYRLIKEK